MRRLVELCCPKGISKYRLEVPVARPGHLVALKLLATDSDTRPQDEIDLDHLVDILDDEERGAARRAVGLIEKRGYSRGRDLEGELESSWAVEVRSEGRDNSTQAVVVRCKACGD